MNNYVEILSILGFGLSIVVLIYTFILVLRRKAAKTGLLLLLAIIIACVTLPLRLLDVDIPNAIPAGHYHITSGFETDQKYSEKKTTVDLYTYYNTEKQAFRIIEIKGVYYPTSDNYYFRGNEKIVISSTEKYKGNATLTIPEVNAKTLGISFVDGWYALSDVKNAFYITWAIIDALLILFYIILQVRSASTYSNKSVHQAAPVAVEAERANANTSVSSENAEKQIVCTKCGATISSSDNYCKSCGTKVEHELDEMSKEELIDFIQKLKAGNNSIETQCDSIEKNISESEHENQPVADTSKSEGGKESETRVSVTLKDGRCLWVPISALSKLREKGELYMADEEDLIVNAELDKTERQIENDNASKKARASFLKLKSDKEFMARMDRIVQKEKEK